MAPELRKRKSVSETQKPNGAAKAAPKGTPKGTPKGKRKAPEDASPVSLKKQKPTKKTPAKSKPVANKKAEEEAAKAVEANEETLDIPDESDSEEEEGKEVQALVTELDSGDEDITEGDNLFKEGQDVGKIPKVSKKTKDEAKTDAGETGVIYIGRIPHGFYENEMRQYFEQFGKIINLRLSRNKKTGASKHYAFAEFAEATTAAIVAKTMNNYLLFGHILKCRVLPKEQVHADLFKGANRRFKKIPWNKMAGQKLQKPLTESAWADKVSKEQSKRAKKAAKLKEIGYEFEAPAIKDVPAPAPVAIENGEAEGEVKAIEAAPAEESKENDKENEVEAEAEAQAEPDAEEKPAKGKKKAPAAKSKAGKGRKARA